ncbi:Hypothetical predicted protein, partial [Marmota monax]
KPFPKLLLLLVRPCARSIRAGIWEEAEGTSQGAYLKRVIVPTPGFLSLRAHWGQREPRSLAPRRDFASSLLSSLTRFHQAPWTKARCLGAAASAVELDRAWRGGEGRARLVAAGSPTGRRGARPTIFRKPIGQCACHSAKRPPQG